MADRRADDNAAELRRAIAWAGAVFAAVGVVGLFAWPRLLVVWVFLIAFGTATLPRIALSKLRELRRRRK